MLITLTTDFGYIDPFAGIMKGVIARINPDARVIDITHGVPPQTVIAGALVLRHSIDYFPPGTIHVVVVDPGVGSSRRPLLVRCENFSLIGPDNGVLSFTLETHKPVSVVELSNREYQLHPTSRTFHGRDIFAPAAAHLSGGADPASFGAPVMDFVRLNWPGVTRTGESMAGRVVYIDGFGNLFTTIRADDLAGYHDHEITVLIRDTTIHGISPTYASAQAPGLVALINSWGLLEIAAPNGSAAQQSGARIGDDVQIRSRSAQET